MSYEPPWRLFEEIVTVYFSMGISVHLVLSPRQLNTNTLSLTSKVVWVSSPSPAG